MMIFGICMWSMTLTVSCAQDLSSLVRTPHSLSVGTDGLETSPPTSVPALAQTELDLQIDIHIVPATSTVSQSTSQSHLFGAKSTQALNEWMKHRSGLISAPFEALPTGMKQSNVTAGLLSASSAPWPWAQATGTSPFLRASSKVWQSVNSTPSITAQPSASMFTGTASPRIGSHLVALLAYVVTMVGIML